MLFPGSALLLEEGVGGVTLETEETIQVLSLGAVVQELELVREYNRNNS